MYFLGISKESVNCMPFYIISVVPDSIGACWAASELVVQQCLSFFTALNFAFLRTQFKLCSFISFQIWWQFRQVVPLSCSKVRAGFKKQKTTRKNPFPTLLSRKAEWNKNRSWENTKIEWSYSSHGATWETIEGFLEPGATMWHKLCTAEVLKYPYSLYYCCCCGFNSVF